MVTKQSFDQSVNITVWRRDKEFEQYPEGARDKTLLYCPNPAPYPFLIPSHQYLLKFSSHRYPEQFWAEVIAYRLGNQMGVPVPRAFVAYDNKNQSAALIEWFLSSKNERYIAGGDYCQQAIPSFDRKKGKQHNFETVSGIFEALQLQQPAIDLSWKSYWAKAFVFDALIGNTDRHQDNWGVIETQEFVDPSIKKLRISPVFDNGTSLGFEVSASNFEMFGDKGYLEKYVSNGWHHMKWALGDTKQIKHDKFLIKLIDKYPETRQIMLTCLKQVNSKIFEEILDVLVKFDVPVKLTSERSVFILQLLNYRHQRLLQTIEY